MQGFHADDGDEGLHGVISEHATAAAIARAGLTGDAFFHLLVGTAGHLEPGDDVDWYVSDGV